jgi:hypothetical protein
VVVYADTVPVAHNGVTEAYQEMKAAPTAYRSSLDAADVATLDPAAAHSGATDASIATITTFYVGNYPNIRVSGRFTTSGATAPLAFVRGHYDGTATTPTLTVIDVVERTLTASDNFVDSNAEYFSIAPLHFDTGRASVIKVLIDSGGVSAGSLDIYVERF